MSDAMAGAQALILIGGIWTVLCLAGLGLCWIAAWADRRKGTSR